MENSNTIPFCLIRNVKAPQRAHPTDAGIDFFVPCFKADGHGITPCPTGVEIECNGDDVTAINICRNASVLIPLGVKVKVPEGYALVFFNKSGVAAKKSLVVGSCVVDETYQGELILNLHNISNSIQTVRPGDKIVQGVLLKMNYATPQLVNTVDELYPEKSERGEGGFGSTN